MRNMRHLVQDYCDIWGYERDEWFYHVDRILNRVQRATGQEKWRLTNIMLDATTEPIIDYNTIRYNCIFS